MVYLFRLFVRRIPREGFKSLAVPALALVLVVLINIMGGVRRQQAADLEDIMDNFEVRVELSDPFTSERDNLRVTNSYIKLFTDPDAKPYSLSEYLKDVELKRVLHIDGETPAQLIGVTSPSVAPQLDPLIGAYIEYFDGYDDGFFRENGYFCVVNEEIFEELDPENPILTVTVRSSAEEAFAVEAELAVVGVTRGAGGDVFCTFWAAGALGAKSDGLPTHSDSMSALMSDNRLIGDFKSKAARHFAKPGDVDSQSPYSLTVFDGVYYDITKKMQQNIRMIDVATPFIYFISVCIGFVASYLLTRRRKPEFAVLRSVGVNKRDVFFGALAEQAVLCVAGVAAGCALFFALYGVLEPAKPAIFTACYLLGSAFSARRAAGTNVLKILREKE